MKPLPLFPSSIIGSMPRPAHVRELIAGDADPLDAGYRSAMERAIREVVGMQEEAGLDVVSDGEWWRKSARAIASSVCWST